MSENLPAVQQKAAFLSNPQTFEEAYRIAKVLASSDLVPKDYKGKPENCLVAMQWGADVGLPGLQALQNIAVVNGRPSVWGDAALAIVKNSPAFQDIKESIEGTGDEMVAVCAISRKGNSVVESRFSVADAKKAGLWGKQGPWTQYTRRMLQMRARGFALRDAFPDALRGLSIAEESQDIQEKEINPLPTRKPETGKTAAPTYYPAASFEKNMPSWTKMVQEGKSDAEQIIAKVSSRAPLTEDQKAAIRAIQIPVTESSLMASPEQMRDVRAAAESATITWGEVCHFLGVEPDAILTADEVPAALEFIANPAGA
jgi:hypothetical protein